MVSWVGPSVFAGQSVGGLVAFLPESFAIGALSVVNTFVSQNLGARRDRRCGQYAWSGAIMVAAFMVLVLPLAAFGRQIFAAIGHSPAVQTNEVLYFRYMILSMPVTLSISVLEQFFYGIHRPRVVFAAAIAANALNIVGDYVLIFGKLGLPALGLRGAAIATMSCWGVQLTILASVFLSGRMHARYATRNARAARLWQCKDIVRIGWPAGLNFIIDIACWNVFTVFLVGRFGTGQLAAANVAARYISLSFMPAVGISVAATALVGRYVGEGRLHLARLRVRTAAVAAVIYMGVCGAAFLAFRHNLIGAFVNIGDQRAAAEGIDLSSIVTYGGRIMVCAAVFQMFDAIGIVYTGALRGAGDTRWPLVVSGVMAVVMLVGGATAMVLLLPQLQSLGPYLAATAYIIALGGVMFWRFRSGTWEKIDLLGDPAAHAGEE
jgi:MATE family multidrug resistance protein